METTRLCFRLSEDFPFTINSPVTPSYKLMKVFQDFTKTIRGQTIVTDLLFIWTDFTVNRGEDMLKNLKEIRKLSIPVILVIKDVMLKKLEKNFFKTLFSSALNTACDAFILILTDYSDKDGFPGLEELFSFSPASHAKIQLLLPYKKKKAITHRALWTDTLNKNNLFIYLWNEGKSPFPEENIKFLPL